MYLRDVKKLIIKMFCGEYFFTATPSPSFPKG